MDSPSRSPLGAGRRVVEHAAEAAPAAPAAASSLSVALRDSSVTAGYFTVRSVAGRARLGWRALRRHVIQQFADMGELWAEQKR